MLATERIDMATNPQVTCQSCGAQLLANSPCADCMSRASAEPIDDFSTSQATRLLSAACYLGTALRTSLLETFVRNRYQAVAPDFGIHLPTVIRHCCYARRRAFVRSLAFCIFELWLVYQYVTSQLTLQQMGLGIMALLAINFIYRWTTFSLICRHFSNGKIDSSFAPALPKALEHLAQPQGNLVVYSGYSPFVGAGTPFGSWSFVTDITRGRRVADGPPSAPLDFQASELWQSVSASLTKLGLHGLSIEDRIYINGQDVRDDARFFDDLTRRPRRSVDSSTIGELMFATVPQAARHYRCIRVVDWKGELAVSLFLRMTKTSTNLFVEASSSILTPIDDVYRLLETTYTRKTFLQVLIRTISSTLTVIPYALWAPFNLAARMIRPVIDLFRHLIQDWLIGENQAYDFGATRSARELASQFSKYRRFSIQRDSDMLVKTLERCVLDAVADFLERQRIDTAGIRERETAILNSGVIISGGTIRAESLAIGRGAMSRVRRMVGKAKAARTATAA